MQNDPNVPREGQPDEFTVTPEPTTPETAQASDGIGEPAPMIESEPSVANESARVSGPETPSQAPSDAPQQPGGFFTAGEPTEAPVEPAAVAPPAGSPKKKRFALIAAIVAAGALVLLGGGSALAYNVWYQNPDKVVTDALVKAVTAKTLAGTGSIKVEQTNGYSMDLTFDGELNSTDTEINATLKYEADEMTLDVKGAGYFSTDGNLYLKFENVRELVETYLTQFGVADTSAFDALITKVDGKWVQISSDDLSEFGDEYEKTQQCFNDAAKLVTENQAATKEITDLYLENKFIVIKESLGSKDIKGVGSLGYSLDGDAAKADAFGNGLKDTQLGKKLVECDDSISFDGLGEEIEKIENEGNNTIELWVSRFGHEVTEINIHGEDPDQEAKGSIVLNPIFNKEVSLSAPTDTITVEELQTEIENAFMEYYTSVYSAAGVDPTLYQTEI